MGGSSGVFSGSNRSPEKVAEKLKSDALVSASKFESTLAKTLNTLLVNYNSRDTDSVKEKLAEIKQALGIAFGCSVDTLFGGSVAKKTYIDGLSDVDSLFIFPDDRDMLPHNLLKKIEKILNSKPGKSVEVSTGNLAVTITYNNGPDIQIIPAIQNDEHIQIPNFEDGTWSEIDPVKFSKVLTKRNQECQGKLIPTIKLAKAINSNLPERLQLSGYHIESLAVAAFKDYSGAKTTASMLPLFFEKASKLVLKPITDKTGQSVHVDEYLGKANSEQRQTASHTLLRLYKRMLNASDARSRELWLDLFGE